MTTTEGGDLRSHLTDIYQRHGRLLNVDVVDEAKAVDHPLHHRFEWNDDEAGHKYRLYQADQLIRSVKITYTPKGSVEQHYVRAFQSAKKAGDVSADSGAYRPTEEIVADPMAKRILLRNMERDIQALRRRYGHIEEFSQTLLDLAQEA